MTLLIEVMESPLDPGYVDAAARAGMTGTHGALRKRSPVRSVASIGLAVILGAGTAIAAQQLRAPESAARDARVVLEEQITSTRDTASQASRRIDDLSAEVAALQAQALSTADASILDIIDADGLANGSLAVEGPGLVISLTNGGAGLGVDPEPDELVKDKDIQTVIQALWAAGAEAIAVDDHRLTMTSAVRNAGNAVLVDLQPLAGPTFVIRALGDANAMQAAFARSDAAAYLQLIGNQFGIRSSVTPQSHIELPSAGTQSLLYAKPVASG
jgi:uncharacterized protein YlxW (UPF0749 family)